MSRAKPKKKIQARADPYSEIGRANAFMAIDQFDDRLKGKDVWDHFMAYADNAADTAMERGGTGDDINAAWKAFRDVLLEKGINLDKFY